MNSFNKKITIIAIIFLLLFIGFQQYLIRSSPPKTDDLILKKIEGIESKLDKIMTSKDSIRTIIDSTHVKIITNEKHYKERINTIISQPLSADSAFITEYIRQYLNKNNNDYIR